MYIQIQAHKLPRSSLCLQISKHFAVLGHLEAQCWLKIIQVKFPSISLIINDYKYIFIIRDGHFMCQLMFAVHSKMASTLQMKVITISFKSMTTREFWQNFYSVCAISIYRNDDFFLGLLTCITRLFANLVALVISSVAVNYRYRRYKSI